MYVCNEDDSKGHKLIFMKLALNNHQSISLEFDFDGTCRAHTFARCLIRIVYMCMRTLSSERKFASMAYSCALLVDFLLCN